MFEFKILAGDKKARVGEFNTPHGKLLTPELAFVATEGEIKSIPKDIISTLSINLIIVNTFHLGVKNIIEKFQPETIHDYANFQKPIMSDSGGFQVFSLGFGKVHGVGKIANIFPGYDKPISDSDNLLKITGKDVTFSYDNQFITLTPEFSMKLQHQIGSDIMFAFDECTSPLNTKEYTAKALERTHHWLKRCLSNHKKYQEKQALFGIVQGGVFKDLRMRSAKFIAKQPVPGFGIGGSLGRTKDDLFKIIEWVIPILPDEKPRHLLGIGQVRDIFESVELGVDLFDCVIPTREARHKVIYTYNGRVNLRKMKNIDKIIEKNCRCLACQNNLTMKQLYQLFLLKDSRAFFFSTIHNIQFYSDLMNKIRNSIKDRKFLELKSEFFRYY